MAEMSLNSTTKHKTSVTPTKEGVSVSEEQHQTLTKSLPHLEVDNLPLKDFCHHEKYMAENTQNTPITWIRHTRSVSDASPLTLSLRCGVLFRTWSDYPFTVLY